MTITTILSMLLIAFAGGVTQSVTGFGSGIVMMLVIPYFLPLTKAAATSSLITLFLQASMMWTYRKHIRFETVIKPLLFFLVVSGVCIKVAAGKDMTILKLSFGIFLVLLSLYFLFMNGKLKVKGGWLSAAVCGSLSGAASGLFGIGGPPMVIYFLALTDGDKLAYLGCIQFFFFVTAAYNGIVRLINGILTVDLLPYVICGITGILIGKKVGTKIVSHIDADRMKTLVYIVLGVSGITNIIGCLK